MKNALTRVIRDIVRRSVSAMDDEVTRSSDPVAQEDNTCTPSEESQTNDSDASKKSAIATTEDELMFFEKVKAIFQNAAQDKNIEVYEPSQRRFVPAEIGYKDTSAYFGIYINKPSWWFLRASVESLKSKWTKNWVGFDLPVERVREALPAEIEMLPPSAFAESRIVINSLDDVDKLDSVILMAINQEIQCHQAPTDGDPLAQV